MVVVMYEEGEGGVLWKRGGGRREQDGRETNDGEDELDCSFPLWMTRDLCRTHSGRSRRYVGIEGDVGVESRPHRSFQEFLLRRGKWANEALAERGSLSPPTSPIRMFVPCASYGTDGQEYYYDKSGVQEG